MLPDISHVATQYLGLAHLLIVSTLIMFREWVISRNTASHLEQRIYSVSTFCIAFSSGAALSFLCVYAIRSAAFSVSWPLFVILFICIVVNEAVSTHSFRFTLDVGVLLTAILFFVIFNLPVITKVQNDKMFLLSIVISFVISVVYLYILQFTSESAAHETPKLYALAIGIPMFVGMLYYLNIIPAVPLSLKVAGVYHSVVHTPGGDFVVEGEKDTRFLSSLRTPLYHLSSLDKGVYFFSAVDSGGELSAPLSHVWEMYDESTKKWKAYDKPISFTLESGREDGYRAYSVKENIDEGLWRVTVKVDTKRIVGRQKFKVVRSSPQPLTVERF